MKTFVIQNTKTGLYAKLDENYNVKFDAFSTGGYGSWGSPNKSFLESQIERLNLKDCKVVDATTLEKEYKVKKDTANELIYNFTQKKLSGFTLLRVLESNFSELYQIAASIYRTQMLEFSEMRLKELNIDC